MVGNEPVRQFWNSGMFAESESDEDFDSEEESASAGVDSFDSDFDAADSDDELKKKLQNIRLNLLVFLTHDCRHLGMMECLKGLQTGFGSATEKR